MKTKNIVPIVSVFFAISACSGSSQDSTPEDISHDTKAIRETVHPPSEEFLQEMVKEEHFSGVALLMRMGEVVHAKGYGDATSENRNSVETIFHVASITKQFTAAAIMQLVEAGLVDLETSVNEYLPEKYRSRNWNSVKIHHLLSHSSGVPDYAVERDYYNVVDGFCLGDTVDGMVKEAVGKDLEVEPGSNYSYSNIGF
jgi:CubicO group peptidase (beta-lactamase class C family)